MDICVLKVTFPELKEMWFRYFTSFPGVNAIEKHVFEKLRHAADLCCNLFEVFFFKFNLFSEYFINGFFGCFDMIRVFRFALREVESWDIRMLRDFLRLSDRRSTLLLDARCCTSSCHLLLSLFH